MPWMKSARLSQNLMASLFYIDDFMKMYEEGARITQKLLSGEMLTTWMQGDEMICEVTHQDA